MAIHLPKNSVLTSRKAKYPAAASIERIVNNMLPLGIMEQRIIVHQIHLVSDRTGRVGDDSLL